MSGKGVRKQAVSGNVTLGQLHLERGDPEILATFLFDVLSIFPLPLLVSLSEMQLHKNLFPWA